MGDSLHEGYTEGRWSHPRSELSVPLFADCAAWGETMNDREMDDIVRRVRQADQRVRKEERDREHSAANAKLRLGCTWMGAGLAVLLLISVLAVVTGQSGSQSPFIVVGAIGCSVPFLIGLVIAFMALNRMA